MSEASQRLFSSPICHSEQCHSERSEESGPRIPFRLFAEPVLSEILRSLLSLRMTRSEGRRMTRSAGRRVTFLPIDKHFTTAWFDTAHSSWGLWWRLWEACSLINEGRILYAKYYTCHKVASNLLDIRKVGSPTGQGGSAHSYHHYVSLEWLWIWYSWGLHVIIYYGNFRIGSLTIFEPLFSCNPSPF